MTQSNYWQDQKLRKVERLRRRAQFLHVQRQGRRFSSRNIVLYVCDSPCAWSRLGLTVSKKVGHSPHRSQWKRMIREAFRRNKSRMPLGADMVVIVKPKRPVPTLDVITQELCALVAKSGEHFVFPPQAGTPPPIQVQ